jgi:hypothetical protein
VTATISINRRGLFGLAAGAVFAASRPAEALAALPAQPTASTLLTQAHKALAQYQARNPLRDRIGIADFSQPSRAPRFYILDLEGGRMSAHLVSHGRGSDPAHTGLLQRFSNDEGSFASSEGCYLTSSHYVGKHGRSMRLIGLDPTNSNAESRAIVVHAAPYVSPDMARNLGKIGRSHGCFAFAPVELDRMLTALGPGRLILAGRF